LEERRIVRRLLGPLDLRSISLATLAILGSIWFLGIAKAVFIPITLAVVTACALSPIVSWLRRVLRLPRPLGAAITLLTLCALLGVGANALQPELIRILDVVPRATAQFSAAVRASARSHDGTLGKLNRAATELERAAAIASTRGTQPGAPPPPMQTAPLSSTFTRYVMMGTANALAGMGQLFVVLSLVFFLLISGESFRLALVHASGRSLAKKKLVLRTVGEIMGQVQRYLLLQVVTSALLGVVVGVVFTVVGLDNAVFWACTGALLHLIPYVGPAVFVAIVSMVAYVQFNAWVPVLAIIVSVLISTGIIGMLVVPWLTQRIGQLNAITTFITLLFWGWLWGVWGLLLGIPVMMAINVVCARTAGLQVLSQFMSGSTNNRRNRRRTCPSDGRDVHVQPRSADL
jgi:predicted PurR-regulated permease PerM